MKKSLSGQQELFIEYIAQGFDQVQAAKKAGYKQPRKAAEKLMNNRR